MNIILLLLLIIALVFLGWLLWWGRKIVFASKEQKLKDERKAKILDYLRENDEVGNKEVRDLLGVSARTVVNYMDELENDGLVEQVGDVGQGTHYKLKK